MTSAERPIDISDVVEFVASQLIRNYVSDKANQAMSTKRKSYFFIVRRLSLCMCVEKGRRLYWWFEWPHKNLVRFVFIFSPISITWLLNLSSRSTMPPTMNSTLATPNLFKFILILGCQLTLYYRSSCWPKKQCGHRRRWLRCVVFWHPTKKNDIDC